MSTEQTSNDAGQTMDAILTAATDAPSAPAATEAPTQREPAQSADATSQREAEFLGIGGTDAATKEANDLATRYGSGEPERDRAGRFTGKTIANTKTSLDADHSAADDDGAKGDAQDAGEDDSYEALAAQAAELDQVADTRRPAGTEGGNAADQPGSSTTKPADPKAADAPSDDDDDEKPLTKEELAEILDTEGRSAWLNAKQYNLRVKERAEARAAKRAEETRASQQQSEEEQRRMVTDEVLPAISKAIEAVPALRAKYGKAGTEMGKFTQAETDAIVGVIRSAAAIRAKAQATGKSITMGKAVSMVLARDHAEDFKRAATGQQRRDDVTVKRHNTKTLAASGAGTSRRPSTDSVKEAFSLADQYSASRRR